MAKIFKTDTQEQTLKDIVDSLKIVTSLNVLLADETMNDCKIRVSGMTEAEQVNEQIPIPYAMISPQLKDYRKKLVKDILDKSKNYSIRLDDNENEILGIKTKKEPEPVATCETNKYETREENGGWASTRPVNNYSFGEKTETNKYGEES